MGGIGIRRQIYLVQMVSSQTAVGTWETIEGIKISMWAEVLNPSGFRDYENGQVQLGSSKSFLIRYRFDLFPDADYKIRFEGKDWTVNRIQKVDEKRFYWKVTATAK